MIRFTFNKTVFLSLILTIICCGAFANAFTAQEKEIADLQIKRLPPTAFPILPPKIVANLQSRGCTIPQQHGRDPMNVVRGAFLKKHQIDWAVLCSINRASSLLVFWGGSDENVSEISEAYPDKAWLQGSEDGIFYERIINVIGKKEIMEYYPCFEGRRKAPPIDHEGIEDVWDGKTSSVYYYYQGKWLIGGSCNPH